MAGDGLEVELRDRTLLLTLALPPSNGLTAGLRRAILRELAARPSDCRAVVLAGAGANFSSLLPLDPDPADPSLGNLCDAVAGAGVPVVAAIQGLAMGPGAELALAASARIGAPGCRIAFPEVALGLCSAAGATRRLPGLTGAAAALQLLLTGRVVPADEALGLGLLDAIAEGALLPAAIALANRLADGQPLPRPVEPAASWQAAIAAARRAATGALPAVPRIIDCVEAAYLLPAANAQDFETVARADLEATTEAGALCAATRAERRAATLPPAVARAAPLPLGELGLVGDGPALMVVARAAVRARIPLCWMHPSPSGVATRLGLPEGNGGGLLRLTDDPADLAGLAVQVHTMAPGPAFRRDAAAGKALLVLDGAEGEMGLAVAPSGRATEVSILAEEAPQAIATAIAGLRRLGLSPLLVGHRPGLGRRVTRAGDVALAHLAASGVPQRQIALALAPWSARLPENPASPGPKRDMDPAEIVNRWLGAMAAAGFHALDQGVARRPSDVDHALGAGHGFPRWQGGPMYQADRRGLLVLRHDLRLWASEHRVWTPSPLLDRLIGDGVRLSSLDERV